MLDCKVCGFKETKEEKMVGIFSFGSSFSSTEDKRVALFGCPKCHTILWTDDEGYISERIKEFKNRNK